MSLLLTFDVFWVLLSSFGAFLASFGRLVAFFWCLLASFGVFWVFVRTRPQRRQIGALRSEQSPKSALTCTQLSATATQLSGDLSG